MRRRYRAAIRYGLAALAGVALACAAVPPTHLRVVSVTLDPRTHKVTAVLLNSTSDKTAVAYILQVKSFDASGKQIDDSGVGWDFMDPDPNPGAVNYILPGQTATATTFAPDTAVSVQIIVTGTVYLDRTAEGPSSGLIFGKRGRQAKAARQALTLMVSYPETPEETRKTTKALVAIQSPLVNGVMAHKLHLRAMPDSQHPPVEESFSKQQWEDLRTELEQKAAFFEAQTEVAK